MRLSSQLPPWLATVSDRDFTIPGRSEARTVMTKEHFMEEREHTPGVSGSAFWTIFCASICGLIEAANRCPSPTLACPLPVGDRRWWPKACNSLAGNGLRPGLVSQTIENAAILMFRNFGSTERSRYLRSRKYLSIKHLCLARDESTDRYGIVHSHPPIAPVPPKADLSGVVVLTQPLFQP